MRTIIELPQDQVNELAALCAREGVSRAEAIRRAVAAYLTVHRMSPDEDAFGIWRSRNLDGRAHEDRVRTEWD